MNAEQASKDLFARADPAVFRGRPSACGEEAISAPTDLAGVVASACMEEEIVGTREAPAVVARDHQPDAGDGKAGLYGVTERPVIVLMPGNAGGAKGP